jgi:two-component system sensor histidine kinase AtoS
MISDTGIGIEEDVKEKIFQPFFTTKSKGTGLGLAITKRLIEQQGGSIIAESNYPKGTVFKISFPLRHSKEEEAA